MLRLWKRSACQQIWRSESGNVAPVSGCGVQNLETLRFAFLSEFDVARVETLCLSTDLVFNVSKRCACQRIWRSESENVVPVSGCGVQNLETLRFLGWKRCACLETLCLSADLVFRIWENCVRFGVEYLETLLYLATNLEFKI